MAGQQFNSTRPSSCSRCCSRSCRLPVTAQDADRPALDRRGCARGAGGRARAAAPDPRIPRRWPSCARPTPTSCPSRSIPRTGRVHTSYHQAVAATGRLSSTDPNLQNIPIRTAEGRRIRQAFIAPPGQVLIAADYSQIELRIMAHLSGDEGLLRAFADDRDIHRATAAEVFGRAARPGQLRPAPLRQGDQLRADLRHVGLRPGAPARHRTRAAAQLRRTLLRALPRRAALHGPHARARSATATSRRCSAAACTCRRSTHATGSCSSTPSAAPSTRRCRARRPTSSSAR